MTIRTMTGHVWGAGKKYIYFVREPSSGAIKIGAALRPASRVKAIQVYNPNPIELLVVVAQTKRFGERALHRRFRSNRLHGEWFRPTPKLLSLVERLLGKALDR